MKLECITMKLRTQEFDVNTATHQELKDAIAYIGYTVDELVTITEKSLEQQSISSSELLLVLKIVTLRFYMLGLHPKTTKKELEDYKTTKKELEDYADQIDVLIEKLQPRVHEKYEEYEKEKENNH